MSGAGPLTPPARDAAQATAEWRNNEEKTFEGRRSQLWPWLDGFGYKGKKIPVSAPKQANKMDW